MASFVTKTRLCHALNVLGFIGFTLQLTGMCIFQNAYRRDPNFRNEFAGGQLPGGGYSAVDYSPIGTSISYGWWITWFQFISVVYTFYALHIDTKKLSGAGNLLGVLAANTFQFTQQVLVGQGSSPASLWSIIHKADGTLIAPYTKLTKYQRASVVLFAGLICNNISNILCSMLVVEPVVAGAAAEAPAAEAPAKEAEEAAVAV